MNQNKKISVVVATYRRDAELVRALESLAGQKFVDFEIIVSDDNNSDEWNKKVSNLIEEFKSEYPNISIKYVQSNPTLGSAMARNLGIEAAEGEYITFLDDDDSYLPDKLSAQHSFMVENGLDFSITNLDLFFENGKLSEHRNREYIKKTDAQSLLKYHFMHHITGTDTMMFTRKYLLEIGCFPPINVGDEFFLMQRAIEGGGKFGWLNRCDVKAYVHTGAGGLSSGEGKIEGENELFEYKQKYFNKFDKKCIKYIKMRHYAVLAFAGLRMKKYGFFIKNAVRSFFASPVQCIKMFLGRK